MSPMPASPFPRLTIPLILICGLPGMPTTSAMPGQNEANRAEAVVRVKAVEVDAQQVSREVTQPATIEPFYQAHIRARAAGYVAEVTAEIGDVVKQGTVLAVIAAPELLRQSQTIRARIERLKSEEIRASAGVDVARANILAADASRKQSEAQVSMTDASLKAITAEFERMQDLVRRGSSEPRLLDEAQQRRDSADASRRTALSAVVAAEAAVTVSQAQHKAAEATLQVATAETRIAEAELQELQVMIDYLELKAPFDGVVTARFVNPGDLVGGDAAGNSALPLFVVSHLSKVRCRIDLSERDAAFVRPGDAVTLKLPAFPGAPVECEVSRTSQMLDPETRTMKVEADIANPDGRFLAGMFGQATIRISTSAAASVLPSSAVRFDAKGNAFVYVLKPDNTVTTTAVTIAADDGQWIQVEGVAAGQRVIDAHLQRFADGQQVQIMTQGN